MRRIHFVLFMSILLVLAATAAVAAPPTAQLQKANVPNLTKAQIDALPPVQGVTPKLRLFRPSIAVPIAWHGPDLAVADPPIPIVAAPAQGQCVDYPFGAGLLYAWKIKNVGEQPTTTPASVEITCVIAPDALPAAAKTYWDKRLCGCMRKTYQDKVPPLPAGKTYGDPPMPLSTVFSLISIPQLPNMPPGPVPCESMMARARVTVRVLPLLSEGSRTGNNSLTMEFCN